MNILVLGVDVYSCANSRRPSSKCCPLTGSTRSRTRRRWRWKRRPGCICPRPRLTIVGAGIRCGRLAGRCPLSRPSRSSPNAFASSICTWPNSMLPLPVRLHPPCPSLPLLRPRPLPPPRLHPNLGPHSHLDPTERSHPNTMLIPETGSAIGSGTETGSGTGTGTFRPTDHDTRIRLPTSFPSIHGESLPR